MISQSLVLAGLHVFFFSTPAETSWLLRTKFWKQGPKSLAKIHISFIQRNYSETVKTWGEVLNYVNELGLLVGGESSGTQRKWETPMLCGNAKIPMSFFWNSLKYFCKHKNIPTSTSAQSLINMVWGMSMSIKWRKQFYVVYFRSLPLTSISKWSGATILLASWTKCPVHKKKSDMWSFQSRELSQCHICWSWMWRNRLFNYGQWVAVYTWYHRSPASSQIGTVFLKKVQLSYRLVVQENQFTISIIV